MKVQARVLKIKVAKFTPKDGSVEFAITYSNDTTKEIMKTDKVVYPESLAKRVVAEVRRTIKSAHQTFEGGELIDKGVDVYVEKEEQLTRQLAHFLEEVRMKVEVVRSMKTSNGYMDAVRAVNRMELAIQ
jgi:hemerythrin-like domain-containing protein